MKKVVVLIIASLFLISPVFAEIDTIGQSRISPASPLYFLKSVREIIELKFAGSSDIKSRRQLEFANRRIRESVSLIKTSHEDLIEPTLTRYAAHLQEFVGIVNPSDLGLRAEIIRTTASHMSILQEIHDKISDQRAKRAIRVAVYKLSEWENTLIDKIDTDKDHSFLEQMYLPKLSGCNFLSKEASSSALNETERYILSERAQKCREIKQ